MAETSSAANPSGEVDFPEPILATKLFIPPARPNLVSRPRLIRRLNQSLARTSAIVLLSAPPGYGKTTLVSSWLHQLAGEPENGGSGEDSASVPLQAGRLVSSAWLSLDRADNDPARFLAYCVAALQTIQPGLGSNTVAMLNDPYARPASATTLITTLINEMVAITRPFIFVLEDYHVIENQLIHDSLSFLFDNLPAQTRLVLTSRTEPPLPLARLRSQGQLIELGPAELRFTPDEVTSFLNDAMDLDLSKADVAALELRTEGWAAGLQMAALSMQGVQDVAGFVLAFTGSHRHIMEYLLEEVLDRQPEQIQRFLLQTSILDRLTGPLCEAVVSSSGAEVSTQPANAHINGHELLVQLDQAHLFIIPLDEALKWYRYHHLFADLLRHRLEQKFGAQNVAGLHRRASDWYEQHGLAAEAMSHALAAVDLERIIRLAKQKAAVMLSRSELVTVLGWLDALPQELARSPSRFPLVQAWAMALTGQLSAVEMHLEEAERLLRANHPEPLGVTEADMIGEIFTLRATVAYFQRDMLQAQALYRQALSQLSPDNLFLRGVVMGGLGAACSWSGDVTAATQAFTEATAISLSSHILPVALIALWNWAQLQVEQGYLRQAYDLYQRALQLVDEQAEASRKTLLAYAGRIYIGLAELMYQWNELEDATSYVQQGLKLAEQEQESAVLAGGYLAWARLKQAQGDQTGALEAVQRAGIFAQRYTGPRYLATQVQIYQVHLWLQQGNLRRAAAWIQEEALQLDPLPDPIPYLHEGEYMVLARLLLLRSQAQNDDMLPHIDKPLATALDLLDRIIDAARAKSRIGRVIEARTLQSRLFLANHQQNRALLALEDALTLAESAGYVRCFVDEGPSIAGLLRQMRASGVEPTYAGQLLAAFQGVKHTGQAFGRLAAQDSQFLLDPLSQRELEILRLIATGMSNRDLAETLVVTVGTVKWHLNNIYSKLAVRSRTQAVARARELGLL